jgi:hypothetical protein
MTSLAGLTFFVTGAARGLGLAIAAKTATFCAPHGMSDLTTKMTRLLTSNPIYS